MVEEPFTLASSHKSALPESLRGELPATASADNASVALYAQGAYRKQFHRDGNPCRGIHNLHPVPKTLS